LKTLVFSSVIALLATSCLVNAAVISTSLGNTGATTFTNGQHPVSSATILGAFTGPAPFNTFCGSDTGNNGSTDCMATWTFPTYSVSGQTITGATLTLGIWDIDSSAAHDAVASYTLYGGDDLTTLLNAAANSVNGGGGSLRNEYDILSVTIPSTSFGVLDTGTAEISLALQAPGLGALGLSPSNGAGLIFSTLEIQTAPVTTTPEPSSFLLLLGGLGAMILARRFRKQFRPGIATQSL
jgi:PEP-CTERM motif